MESVKWLILEDVDKGPADLPILLSPVLRHLKDGSSQVLHPNTGKPITRHQNFELILTKRTSMQLHVFGDHNTECDIFSAYCSIIYMECMSSEIIEKVISYIFNIIL